MATIFKSLFVVSTFVFLFTSTDAAPSVLAPLPPTAQETLDKGIIAARVPDYLLAIRYFDEARKLAPQAPVVFLNMGLAESRIPGRELRAMALFGAYLSAYPAAPNAAAVKEQITALGVKNQNHVSGFLKLVQDAVAQLPVNIGNNLHHFKVAQLWFDVDDFSATIRSSELIKDKDLRERMLANVAHAQVIRGNILDAQITTDTLQIARFKSEALVHIAKARFKAGDLTGAKASFASALNTADQIVDSHTNPGSPFNIVIVGDWLKGRSQADIASAQAEVAELEDAQRTANAIKVGYWKVKSHIAIGEAQLKRGNAVAANASLDIAQKILHSIESNDSKAELKLLLDQAKANIGTRGRSAVPEIPPMGIAAVSISEWVKKLDDDNQTNDCPLNTELFLNYPTYLKSLKPSANVVPGHEAGVFFASIYGAGEKLVKARKIVLGMFKQEAVR